MTNDSMKNKKYILKPGRHQFVPGSPAVHHNDNLSDAEAEWYLEKYPHIASLFESPNSVMQKEISTSNNNHIQPYQPVELLTPPSGGWGEI
jgi:hypothetical protein